MQDRPLGAGHGEAGRDRESALRGRPGEAFGIVGYLVPWTAVAFALAVPQLGVAVPVAGVLLIAGQAWSKWLLVLTVADVRPVTLGTLTLQRRVS